MFCIQMKGLIDGLTNPLMLLMQLFHVQSFGDFLYIANPFINFFISAVFLLELSVTLSNQQRKSIQDYFIDFLAFSQAWEM